MQIYIFHNRTNFLKYRKHSRRKITGKNLPRNKHENSEDCEVYDPIAKELEISRSSYQELFAMFLRTRSVLNQPRYGRPRRLQLKIVCKIHDCKTSTKERLQDKWCTTATSQIWFLLISRRASFEYINWRRAIQIKKKQTLTKKHLKSRLIHLKWYESWIADIWNKMIFRNETRIEKAF